jgi:hypothetical protein
MAFNNQLLAAQLRAEALWDAMKGDPSKMPRINALAAVMAETTSRINTTYSDPEKKRTNQLFWLKRNCTQAEIDGAVGCTLNFDPLSFGQQTYTLTRKKHQGFSNGFREYETSMFQRTESEAEGIIATEQLLFKGLNARVHAFINDPANLTNFSAGGFVVDPADNTIVISPERWTPRLMGTVTMFAQRLGMIDPYIISGNALYDMLYDTKMDTGMEDNIGKANRMKGHRIYLDWTLDSTLGGEEKFFLIERGALALLNRESFKNRTPISLTDMNNTSGRLAWSKPSTVLNTPIGVGVDGKPVTLTIDRSAMRTCVDGEDFLDQHGFQLNADIVRMPDADCTDDAQINGGEFVGKYTGILAFKCGNPALFAVSGSGSGA